MTAQVIIGLTGAIASGKSTAAEYITTKYQFQEYMFAKPLKDIAILMGFEYHQVYGTQEQKLEINQLWGISGRKFLQDFGTEVCREFLPELFPTFTGTLWIKLFEKYCNSTNANIVVSDVRFNDEAECIIKSGGIIIELKRGDNIDKSHKSEIPIDKKYITHTILNNGTLQVLYDSIDSILQ
jgi:hypothetical protein